MIFEEKTLSSERIYEGRVINLRRDKVTVMNGTSYREVVEHDGGAVVLAIDRDDRVVMVKQYRKPFDKVILELPAGKIEKDEDPQEAALRELKEETGCLAGEVKSLGRIFPSVGYTSEILYLYMAWKLEQGQTNFDENEAIEVVKIPFREAVDMVIRGEICDAKTVAGLLIGEKVKQWQIKG